MSNVSEFVKRIHWSRNLSLVAAAFTVGAGGYVQSRFPQPPASFREIKPAIEPAAVAGVWYALPMAVGLLIPGMRPVVSPADKRGEDADGNE